MRFLAVVFGLIANVSAAQEWIKICASNRTTCSAGQAVFAKDDARLYLRILFSLDEQQNLHMAWVSPKLARPDLVIALDHYQLGNLLTVECSDDDCEGKVTFSKDQKEKVFAAKEMELEFEINDDHGARFPFDLTNLEKTLAQP